MNTQLLEDLIEQVLATAQAGLTFSKDRFDIARFECLRDSVSRFLAQSSGTDFTAIRNWISLDSNYPTPKVDVRAIILDAQGNLLLVREKCDGRWTVPGGWCDIGQSPKEAVEREVLEETGLVCTATQLLALFDKHKHPHPPQLPHAYKAFFRCEVTGGELLQETPETAGAEYFSPDDLPPLSEHRVLRAQIQLLHSRICEGIQVTLFD